LLDRLNALILAASPCEDDRMNRTKRRARQHIMEDRSMRIVRDRLPDHWVVRDYRPDYGIDLLIEVFEFVDAERTQAATLGETLFVQVKSTRVHGRRNVEKGPLEEDRSRSTEMEVIPLRLETSELLTVQAMGAAIPVLLLLVELSTGRIYYVCLNDLIEKVILPRDPAYETKQSKVIHVPARNCIIPGDPLSVRPLETYARRAKLYAAFAKLAYQRHELDYALASFLDAQTEVLQEKAVCATMKLVRHFLAAVLRYDFWTRMPEWLLIGSSHRELLALQSLLGSAAVHNDLPALQTYLLNEPVMRREERWVRSMELPEARTEFCSHLGFVWDRLTNLARVYEEFGREWFLPTYLSERHVGR
jgi:hypothetical protein